MILVLEKFFKQKNFKTNIMYILMFILANAKFKTFLKSKRTKIGCSFTNRKDYWDITQKVIYTYWFNS